MPTDPADTADPASAEEAQAVQRAVAARVEIPSAPVPAPRRVAGLDVSYETGSDRAVAAAVVVETGGHGGVARIVEEVVVEGSVTFPYVPGLLAFREVPLLERALQRLRTPVDLLLCDGQGIAHPRRCGLACHLGVRTGLPAVGCAKNHLVGEHNEPRPRRGDREPLVDGGDILGYALRTRDGVRSVYVSPGHRIGVAQAAEVVLALCSAHRLPDPLRRADHVSRRALR
ncbi:MAG TPA: endonuclease V [Pseudonocardia sp.]|nr:endonuclease V [Pseudonocardia sp.]